ncbi:MAG: hypothetical protein NT061_09375 [Spirochaetes bacterium]|nr:hypothetical protein [Spirochaetota bacterium]
MKKLVLLLVATLIAVSSASAATLGLTGSVANYTNVTLGTSSMAFSFTGDGSAGTAAASTSLLTVFANTTAWTVTLTSAKSGSLYSTATTTSIPYYIQAALQGTFTGTVTNSMSSTVLMGASKTIQATAGGKTPKQGVGYLLTISIPAQNVTDTLWQTATDYADTITVTVIGA